MKGRKSLNRFLLFAGFTFVFAGILRIGLWNANGGILDFLRGQTRPEPKNLSGDVCVRTPAGSYPVQVRADLSGPVFSVSPEFLSFAIDSSQVVGGKWWNPEARTAETGSGTLKAPVFNFDRPGLDELTRALAPAYLRIGGSEADKIFYDMERESPEIPPGYHSVLTASQWDHVNSFAKRNGLKLGFTLNTGPASRNSDGAWNPANAEILLSYSQKKNYKIDIWELGNELNIFWFVHGLKSQVSTEQYALDLKKARELVLKYQPSSHFAGQGSAFWPLLGEPLGFFYAYMPDFLRRSSSDVDQVSWHYYPQQSRRGPIASRRAFPARLLDPKNLDEVGYWADRIREWRDAFAPGKPIWLGETGNAQFGGEPGLSDVYLGGLWWLDQLGLLAQKGEDVVVRQTLSGMNYGLIEDETLSPRADYWNSLVWKKLMGQKVYRTSSLNESPRLRVYAHSSIRENCHEPVFLVINLDPDKKADVSFPDMFGRSFTTYVFTTRDIFSNHLLLNGEELRLENGRLPAIQGQRRDKSTAASVTLLPLSYAFVDFCE